MSKEVGGASIIRVDNPDPDRVRMVVTLDPRELTPLVLAAMLRGQNSVQLDGYLTGHDRYRLEPHVVRTIARLERRPRRTT